MEYIWYFVFWMVRVCNGWGFNVVIMYGDIDSVFLLVIDFGDDILIKRFFFFIFMDVWLFLFENFEKICDMVNGIFLKEMNLDFEKMFERLYYCIFKCYVLRMCEGKEKDYFIMVKGLFYVWRGGCLF